MDRRSFLKSAIALAVPVELAGVPEPVGALTLYGEIALQPPPAGSYLVGLQYATTHLGLIEIWSRGDRVAQFSSPVRNMIYAPDLVVGYGSAIVPADDLDVRYIGEGSARVRVTLVDSAPQSIREILGGHGTTHRWVLVRGTP